jgi:tetratricopeptide (TPR) repeat protein
MRSVLLLFVLAASLNAQAPPSCQAGLDQVKGADYVNGQSSLWSCVESGSGSPEHTYYLTLTYRELKNYDSGLSKANAALKQTPDSVEMLYLAAFLHYRRGENKDSMLLLSKAYKQAPDDWRIHQLFALNYITFKMYAAVEAELRRAIALNPTNAELEYQLGRLYFTQNWFDKSIAAMRRALALTPDYPEVYDSLGLSYEALQDEKQAEESYTKAIELDRKHGIKDPWPLINYAKLLFYQESPQASLPYLSQALEIDPRSPEANYQMGRVMRALHRNAEAEKYFEKTIDVDASFANAYYQLGTLLQKRGENARAAVLLNRFKILMETTEQPTVPIPNR